MGEQESRRPRGRDEDKTRHDAVEPGRDAPGRDAEPSPAGESSDEAEDDDRLP